MYYIKDDNGIRSQTTTLVWVGISIASIKLILAGGKFWGLEFGEFSGSDYAMVVGPFLALLAHKRQVNSKKQVPNLSKEQKDDQA